MWERVKLNNVIEKPISGEWGSDNGTIPIIRTTNFTNDGSLNLDNVVLREISEQKVTKKRLQEGDTIIEKSGGSPTQPVGRVVYFGEDSLYLCNNFTSILRPKNNINPKYLFWRLFHGHASKETLKFQNKTTGIINLQLERYINETIIPLPPLPVQQRIADTLDKADALRRKDQELLKKYDELAQSIFIDMFGDPVKNEKGWEVRSLGELTSKILSGNTPKGGSDVYVDAGIEFFRSQNVWRNRLDKRDIAYIDESTHNKMKNSSLMYKDILMTKTGRFNTENSSLGRAAMFVGKNNSANINGHVYLIRINSIEVISEFVLYILTTIQFRDLIRRVCVGGIDKRQLNKEHIEKFPIIVPPVHLQKSFAKKIELINQLKAKTNAEKSEELFQSLLQGVFRD